MPSKVIEFRGLAVNITHDGHSVQAISQSMKDIDDWAHKIAETYGCHVKIYILREHLLKNVRPKLVKVKK